MNPYKSPYTDVGTMDLSLPDGTIAILTIKDDKVRKHNIVSMLETTYVKPKTAFEKLVEFVYVSSKFVYTEKLAQAYAKALLEIYRAEKDILFGISDGFTSYANSHGIPVSDAHSLVRDAFKAGF